MRIRQGFQKAILLVVAASLAPLPAEGQPVEFDSCGIDCELDGRIFRDAPLTVTMSPLPTAAAASGENVTFTVRVRNSATATSAELSALFSDVYGDVSEFPGNPVLIASSCALPQSLARNDLSDCGLDEYSCSFEVFVSGSPGGTATHTLSAELTYVEPFCQGDGTTPCVTAVPDCDIVGGPCGILVGNISVDSANVDLVQTTAAGGASPIAMRSPGSVGPPDHSTGIGSGRVIPQQTASTSPAEEELLFFDINGSGIDATLTAGADFRIYDTAAYTGVTTVSGQSLVDFSWPTGEPANRDGTTIALSQPVRKFCLEAGDFGSDDDVSLQIEPFLGGTAGTPVSVGWDEMAGPPFAWLQVDSGGPFDRFVFKSFGLFPNSVFIDGFSFIADGVAGPPGVPDGTIGSPMRVAKVGACDGSVPSLPVPCPVDITWDTFSCCTDVDDHHLVHGVGSSFPASLGGNYVLTGTECLIGPAPPYAWGDLTDPKIADPSSRLIWWLIVGSQGGVEGSWGSDSDNTERDSTSPGVCQAKVLTNRCGQRPTLRVDLDRGLVAHYALDGDGVDASCNDNDGTVFGTQTVIGVVDDSLRFAQSVNDYVALPHTVLNGLGDFSFSFFAIIDGNNSANNLLSGSTVGSPNSIVLKYNNNGAIKGWRLAFDGPNFAFPGSTQMQDFGWHHIAVTREGDMASLYVDGVEFGSISVPDDPLAVDSGGLFIGQDQSVPGGGFSATKSWFGKIDDLRIYDRALSAREVLLHFEQGTLP